MDILHYLPPVVADSKEFKNLGSTEDEEFSTTWDVLYQWFLNTFIYDFDEAGLERWEDMLSITPEESATFKVRRTNVLLKLSLTLPYTFLKFQIMLKSMFPNSEIIAIRNVAAHGIWLKITTDDPTQYAAILKFTRAIIPANMGVNVYYGYSWNGVITFDGTHTYSSNNLEE